MPWMVIATLWCLRRNVYARFALPLVFAVGAFLKLSASVLAAALCLYAIWSDLLDTSSRRLLRTLRAAVPVLSFTVFYYLMNSLYTSRGWTAVSAHRITGLSLRELVSSLLYSLASLNSAFTSFLAVVPYFRAPRTPQELWDLPGRIGVVLACAILSILLVLWVFRRAQNSMYSRLCISVVVAYVAMMTLIYVNRGARLEYRHFWIVGAILLPGVVDAVRAAPRVFWPVAAIAGITCAFGIASYVVQIKRNVHALHSGDFAFAREQMEAARVIAAIDRPYMSRDQIIFVNDPRVALLVHNSRLAFATTDLSQTRFYGTTPSLTVIIERQEVVKRSAAGIMKVFPDMSVWEIADRGPFAILVSGSSTKGGGQPVF